MTRRVTPAKRDAGAPVAGRPGGRVVVPGRVVAPGRVVVPGRA